MAPFLIGDLNNLLFQTLKPPRTFTKPLWEIHFWLSVFNLSHPLPFPLGSSLPVNPCGSPSRCRLCSGRQRSAGAWVWSVGLCEITFPAWPHTFSNAQCPNLLFFFWMQLNSSCASLLWARLNMKQMIPCVFPEWKDEETPKLCQDLEVFLCPTCIWDSLQAKMKTCLSLVWMD